MHLDADYKAEILASERFAAPVRAALAYFALGLGMTGTLAMLPTVVALLAARGLQ